MNNYWGTPDAQRNDPIIRMPEIYLNYAEALNEYNDGPNQEAFDAINKLKRGTVYPAPLFYCQFSYLAQDYTLSYV